MPFLSDANRLLPAVPFTYKSSWLQLFAKLDDALAAMTPAANVINVTDPLYGAVGDDATDNVTAFAAAIAAIPAGGGALYIPAGIYRVSDVTILSKQAIYYGDGAATIIKTTHATHDIFRITGGNVVVKQMSFTTSVTRSGGYYIDMQTSLCYVTDFYMTGFYVGIHIPNGTAITKICRGSMRDGVPSTGVAILFNGGLAAMIDEVVADHPGGDIAANIRVTYCGDLIITSCNLIRANYDLDVDVPAGSEVVALWALNTFFDTAGVHGVRLKATSTGGIYRCIFEQCWASTAGNHGFQISTASGGTIDGVDINDCHMFINSGNGINVEDSGCKNIRVHGGAYCGNGSGAASGIAFIDTIDGGCVIGARVGNGYQFSGNSTYGIYIGTGCTNITIADNDLRNNGTAAIAVGAVGTGIYIHHNQGCVTCNSGAATIAIAGTSVTVTHGLGLTPVLQDISVTPYSGWSTATSWWISNVTATTFLINCAPAPAVAVSFVWEASVYRG